MSVITLGGSSSWRPPANQSAGRSATLAPPSPVRGQRDHDAQLAKITNVAHVQRSRAQALHCGAFAGLLALICGPFQLTGGQQLKKSSVGQKSTKKQGGNLSSESLPLMFLFFVCFFHYGDESPLLFPSQLSQQRFFTATLVLHKKNLFATQRSAMRR